LTHSAHVLAYIRRRHRGDGGEDLLAETFLVAWRRLPSMPDGRELPWLYGIARNVIRARWRREASESQAVATLTRSFREEAPELVGHADVRELLMSLTADQVEVLLLSGLEGLSGGALATALGCNPVAARVRLHRARRALTDAEKSPTNLNVRQGVSTPIAERTGRRP